MGDHQERRCGWRESSDVGRPLPVAPALRKRGAIMCRSLLLLAVCCGLMLVSERAWGQLNRSGSGTSAARSNTSGMSGSNGGLQQTGQLTSNAAISRDANAFVGDSSGSFLSRSGSQGTMRGGTTGMLGSGVQGMSTLGTIGAMGMMGGMSGRSSMMGGRGSSGMNQMNQQMGNTGRTGRTGTGATQLRTPLRLGFEVPRPPATEVSARLVRRMPRIPGLESVSGVAVRMDGRTAVLQGVVASQNQRDLMARLALLEPGVSDVRNELVVNSSGTSAASPAAESVPANTP